MQTVSEKRKEMQKVLQPSPLPPIYSIVLGNINETTFQMHLKLLKLIHIFDQNIARDILVVAGYW